MGMMGLSAESGLLHKMVQKGVLVREETAKRRMKDETVRMLALSLPEEGIEQIRLTEKQKDLLRQFDAESTGKEYEGAKSFLDKVKSLFN